MPHQRLTRTLAIASSEREVCIDSQKDVWVKVRVPSPRVLMEFEAAKKEDSFTLIFKLVQDNLLEPKIVETASTNENEVTIDELGGYFLPIATAIMDSVDVSGEMRKKAESFLADQHRTDGSVSGVGVLHAPVRPPGV